MCGFQGGKEEDRKGGSKGEMNRGREKGRGRWAYVPWPWRPEIHLVKSVLCFHFHTGSGHCTQVSRLGARHPADPWPQAALFKSNILTQQAKTILILYLCMLKNDCRETNQKFVFSVIKLLFLEYRPFLCICTVRTLKHVRSELSCFGECLMPLCGVTACRCKAQELCVQNQRHSGVVHCNLVEHCQDHLRLITYLGLN